MESYVRIFSIILCLNVVFAYSQFNEIFSFPDESFMFGFSPEVSWKAYGKILWLVLIKKKKLYAFPI